MNSEELFPAIKQLVDILKLDRQYSIYSSELTLKERLEELQKELQEALAEVGEDEAALQDEMGDLFLDLLAACIIAEESGRFNTADAITGAADKIRRRKPFLLENRRPKDIDEEAQIYRDAKAKEKL